jgi:hypothetical protein
MRIVVNPEAAADIGPIYVELDTLTSADGLGEIYDDVETRERAADKVLNIARDVYSDGLDLARRCAQQASTRLRDLGKDVKPDEVELQLSIKLDAELGAVLVKSGAEAQLQVTFRWNPADKSLAPQDTP